MLLAFAHVHSILTSIKYPFVICFVCCTDIQKQHDNVAVQFHIMLYAAYSAMSIVRTWTYICHKMINSILNHSTTIYINESCAEAKEKDHIPTSYGSERAVEEPYQSSFHSWVVVRYSFYQNVTIGDWMNILGIGGKCKSRKV